MMMDLQSKNFGIIQKRINSALSYSAEEKYQELLHFQPEIIQRIPSTMVAAYLGISRETLSRIRNQAQKK
jgi:CRP-like cAMP-binding protein